MLRIVVDSAGDLPEGWEDQFDVQTIPINIHFGDRTFLEGIDMSHAEFYHMADETGIVPKTSQPTPQQFIDFYKKIADLGDTILSLHITSKLSGTMASAQIAARELIGKYNIIPFDTLSGSAAVGFMAREARLMERAGAAVEKIVDRLKVIARNVHIVLTINTMEYARRSGRVKALQAALASMLNVKPVIYLREGALEVGDKVRTRSRSLEYIVAAMAKRMGSHMVNAAVVHSEDIESAKVLMARVRAVLNCRELVMTELSIGIAANLGPGTIGVVAYPVEGE